MSAGPWSLREWLKEMAPVENAITVYSKISPAKLWHIKGESVTDLANALKDRDSVVASTKDLRYRVERMQAPFPIDFSRMHASIRSSMFCVTQLWIALQEFAVTAGFITCETISSVSARSDATHLTYLSHHKPVTITASPFNHNGIIRQAYFPIHFLPPHAFMQTLDPIIASTYGELMDALELAAFTFGLEHA